MTQSSMKNDIHTMLKNTDNANAIFIINNQDASGKAPYGIEIQKNGIWMKIHDKTHPKKYHYCLDSDVITLNGTSMPNEFKNEFKQRLAKLASDVENQQSKIYIKH